MTPRYHIIFAYSYRSGTLPFNWWVEDGNEDIEHWFDEQINNDPGDLESLFQNVILKDDGIYHFTGTLSVSHDPETGVPDDFHFHGTVGPVFKFENQDW